MGFYTVDITEGNHLVFNKVLEPETLSAEERRELDERILDVVVSALKGEFSVEPDKLQMIISIVGGRNPTDERIKVLREGIGLLPPEMRRIIIQHLPSADVARFGTTSRAHSTLADEELRERAEKIVGKKLPLKTAKEIVWLAERVPDSALIANMWSPARVGQIVDLYKTLSITQDQATTLSALIREKFNLDPGVPGWTVEDLKRMACLDETHLRFSGVLNYAFDHPDDPTSQILLVMFTPEPLTKDCLNIIQARLNNTGPPQFRLVHLILKNSPNQYLGDNHLTRLLMRMAQNLQTFLCVEKIDRYFNRIVEAKSYVNVTQSQLLDDFISIGKCLKSLLPGDFLTYFITQAPLGNAFQDLSYIRDVDLNQFPQWEGNTIAHYFAIKGNIAFLEFVREHYPHLLEIKNYAGETPLALLTKKIDSLPSEGAPQLPQFRENLIKCREILQSSGSSRKRKGED